MEEEYPHDHYLTLVKNVFIMGDVELRDYKEYCEISGKFLIFFLDIWKNMHHMKIRTLH